MRKQHRFKGLQPVRGGRSNGISRAPVALQRALPLLLVAGLIMLLAVSAFAQVREMRGHGADRSRGQQVRGSQPGLVWLDGVLTLDRAGAWMLTRGTPLKTLPGMRWRDEDTGREASPSAGRTVRLMGQWRGGVFHVRQATLISQQRAMERQRQAPPQAPATDPPPSEVPQ